jgi:predicted enzyme related to lactoylglutathione lyase
MAENFFWYELMTTDVAAAETFYKTVIGWNSEPFGGGMPYIVLKAGDTGVGGIMAVPEGSGLSPAWVGYIHSKNVDAATEGVKNAGGTVHREPADIPGVGRFSVVADPQGAMFMLLQPNGPDQPPPPMTPGHIGWHELYASDWRSAFDFYSGQFGWEKVDEMDMGPVGKYLLYKAGGADMAGGMMTKPDNVPAPVWQFYFIVDDIDAAVKRVTGNGGKILMEPMAVPGDAFVIQAMDPQGAVFSVTGPRK